MILERKEKENARTNTRMDYKRSNRSKCSTECNYNTNTNAKIKKMVRNVLVVACCIGLIVYLKKKG